MGLMSILFLFFGRGPEIPSLFMLALLFVLDCKLIWLFWPS
jgi:hypothetical protein